MMTYFSILHFLSRGDKKVFDLSVEEQQAFINSLGAPLGGIDRSFLQYRCHMFFSPFWKRVVFSLISVFLLPIMFVFLFIRGVCTNKGEQVYALMQNIGMDEVVPSSVFSKYNPNVNLWKKRASISIRDMPFLLKIIRVGFFSPYFVLRTMINMAFYSNMIHSHNPSVIIAFMEYSYSSSLLTEFCHTYSVSHINIMHGEKMFFIRDSFFWFDECYVWDQHYIDLFLRLRAEPTQFRVELPPSLSIDVEHYRNSNLYADYKYYLAEYTEEQIVSIVTSMEFALKDGQSILYRPHPRYSDLDLLKKYVSIDRIEFPDRVSIAESVSNCTCAVGCYTTVLLQAYMAKKDCILDDVTFKSECDKLGDYGYILATVDCGRLSDLQ